MKFLWLAGLAIVGVVVQADAATVRKFKAGSWDASVHADESGAFTHCTASATYKSDISVIFSITKNFRWVVAFTHPAWKYRMGDTFPVAFTVDGMKPLSDRATAYTTSAVRIELADSSGLFQRFKQGRVLKVATAQRVFQFNLTGTNEMLSALLDCAGQKGGLSKVPMASNPFAPTTPDRKPAAQSGTNDLALRAEATTLAANLLSAAGLPGYRLMLPTEVPQMRGDARWIIPGEAIGTVRIFSSLGKEERRSLGGHLIADDAKLCKGRFASGSIPDEDGTVRVFTVCEEGTDVISMYYFTLPRSAGGTYVIATGSFGDAEKATRAKETHEDFRRAAYQACEKSIGCKER